MLTYDLLKNHAGILLCGDYKTLQALHEVNDNAPIIRDKEGSFLGLAGPAGAKQNAPCVAGVLRQYKEAAGDRVLVGIGDRGSHR